MTALTKLTKTQFKLYLREPMAFFFTMVFPVMLLVLFGAIFSNDPNPFYNNMGYVDFATPALIVFVIVTVMLMSVPIKTASDRELGVLRRFRATPLRPRVYMASDVLMHYLITLVGALLLLVVGVLAFDLNLTENWVHVWLAFTLSALSFAALGYLIAAYAPTARVAQTVGMALFFPMMFLSGAAFPLEIMPEALQTISKFLPMTMAVELLQGVWFGESWSLYTRQTFTLIGMLAICAIVAARAFRWE
ncbi:MAG: ABC transporter permease [Chloroflexi bacterium]|nr:ABC transporter permease [Chloroflexota bacterium]